MHEKSKSPLIRKFTRWAEANAKVPYDVVNPSNKVLHPNVHRQSTRGHDPIFGLIYGTIDILRNTCTFVDDRGKEQVVENVAKNAIQTDSMFKIPEAITRVILHYMSDVFTERGLPAPFMAQIQQIQMDSGFTLEKGGATVSVSHLTRHMYQNGYDFRHFLTMAIVPGFAELLIRTYHAVRVDYEEDANVGKEGIRGELKLSKMLLLTHALLSSTNILKTALYRWDPTALNLAQFVALARQMFLLLKLSHDRNSLVAKELEDGYKKLLRKHKRN